jgi:hypothetical protein
VSYKPPLSQRDLDAAISVEAVVGTARQLRARIGGFAAAEFGANMAEALLRAPAVAVAGAAAG